jgi:hypothetical protein
MKNFTEFENWNFNRKYGNNMTTLITKEQQKQLAEDHEKATLLKDSLKIVDELGKIDWNDMGMDEDDMEHLEALNKRAKKLRKNRLFVLK